jgi:hypothetical protein
MMMRDSGFRSHCGAIAPLVEALEIAAGVEAHRAKKAAETKAARERRKERQACSRSDRGAAPAGEPLAPSPRRAAQHVLNERAAAMMLAVWLRTKAIRDLGRVNKTTDFTDPKNALALVLIACDPDKMIETLTRATLDIWNDETLRKERAATLRRPPGLIADDEAKKFWRRAGARLDRETARKRAMPSDSGALTSGPEPAPRL